jgi:predicted metal-binding transcription factor (methanogenesis marker protein 9)
MPLNHKPFGGEFMSDQKFVDIAHLFFLEAIVDAEQSRGAAVAKGELIRRAKSVAARMPGQDFASTEELINALDGGLTVLTKLEGQAKHQGNNIFTLKSCPFGRSIKTYMNEMGSLPKEYKEITEEFNKSNPVNDELKIGNGSAVSPFCCIHQPLRSIVAGKLTVKGQPTNAYMLGCKSGSGTKAFADKNLQESGVDKAVVDKLLDDNMCCYWINTGKAENPA